MTDPVRRLTTHLALPGDHVTLCGLTMHQINLDPDADIRPYDPADGIRWTDCPDCTDALGSRTGGDD